ncbi:malto-oligosyltrehalose trehalohydrolase [Pandoraea faecigallinarum]|uniref:Malto-oligosyltrehalose trehalohydrolase n=1 Tax=Pandoraea faecigallinarum TaxID=656179 RepID=A0A0H3X2V6_9BURK|nr:malto-oligosyltrehalose trehalohydrolase [Pandoraea faecigallinarum]AKM33126.1 malto-oligosyltrehalose trehalohydrolase [Pandoraea faecigallinarum]
MTTTYAFPLPFGAALQADGTTRFRIWAPDVAALQLVIEQEAPVPMLPSSEGHFELTVPCIAGTRYAFVLPDGRRVPDPASRAQAGGPHDMSVVIDPRTYAWQTPGWRARPWHETVIYELHAGALGGYNGVRARLPYLAQLGVSAIELMPIGTFEGRRNWGYDGVLPFAPESAYGTVEELKALIDAAHAEDMMVFLDVVYNHFGPSGNYLASYASRFFDGTAQTPWGASLDFDEPCVRQYFIQNALYWLFEFRVDALRLDAVHAIGNDAFVQELATCVRDEIAARDPGRHAHLIFENEHNAAALLANTGAAQWNDDFHNSLHVLLTGERQGYYADFAEKPVAHLARALAEGFAYQGERVGRLDRPRGEPSSFLSPTSFVSFLQNHDQVGNRPFGDRLATQAHPAALRAAVALLLLCPQIPMLFMGEEWASDAPFLFFTDYRGALADAVREGRREEFARLGGDMRASVPDPNDPETFAASCLAPGEQNTLAADDWLSWYRGLIELRRTWIVPRLPGATSAGVEVLSPTALSARWRLNDGAVLAIVVNLGELGVATDTETLHPAGVTLCQTPPQAADALAEGSLRAHACVAWLEEPL